MSTNLEIERSHPKRPIQEVAAELGIDPAVILPHGHHIAKIPLSELTNRTGGDGALVLVTAMSPTLSGEGKTTTTIGLGDALRQAGRKTAICLREPSLGPYFGIKGGGTGAGQAQVVPAEDINLHFVGDMYSVEKANNLLAALIDNHLQHGNDLGIDPRKVAVELNLEIVPRSQYPTTPVNDGDKLEVVHFIGGGADDLAIPDPEPLEVAGVTYRSRLLVGTGKYKDFEETARAIEASGAEIVTVAVRRVNVTDPAQPMLVDFVDPKRYTYLPNTAGCYTVEEAITTAKMGRELLDTELVKLEVIGDDKTLFPDVTELLKAAEQLLADGFVVLPYCNDDPVTCQKLADAGCAAVMPLGAPIGSGMGICNPYNIALICARSPVPVILDAGLGPASDAALAMALGCDAVMVNTAIAQANDPVNRARAMGEAVAAGRRARLAGRIPRRAYGEPSSPQLGLIGSGS